MTLKPHQRDLINYFQDYKVKEKAGAAEVAPIEPGTEQSALLQRQGQASNRGAASANINDGEENMEFNNVSNALS